MRTRQTIFFFLLIILMMGFRCKKDVNPCMGAPEPRAEFAIKELLRDTAFNADTIYGNNPARFETSGSYISVSWKIGDDPRNFTSSSFSLPFNLFRGDIDVHFTGRRDPNPICFPGDSGVYRGKKSLTIVEFSDTANLTVSPLVGHYRGAFNTTPNDTFTVRIEFFRSRRYDPLIMGDRTFYWISNIPKGYIDSTSEAARQYPELRNGMRPYMGYKCLQFGDYGDINMGLGMGQLSGDTLRIYYRHIYTGRKVFIGRKI